MGSSVSMKTRGNGGAFLMPGGLFRHCGEARLPVLGRGETICVIVEYSGSPHVTIRRLVVGESSA